MTEHIGVYISCSANENSLDQLSIANFIYFIGNPVPEIKWLKDGQLLVPDTRHQILSHGRFLQISAAQIADTGRYSCLASNSAGERSRHFNLNVLGTNTMPFCIIYSMNKTIW